MLCDTDQGGLEESVLAGPVQVDGAFGDAGVAGDLVDAGLVEAEAGEAVIASILAMADTVATIAVPAATAGRKPTTQWLSEC